MTRQTRNRLLFIAIAAALLAAVIARWRAPSARPRVADSSANGGGEVVASVHTDPRSFNRLVARDSTTDLVTMLTQARLLRLNRVTQEMEPWLAESWNRSADGLTYTLKLRPGVTFSDGHPFTASDVLFSFEAAYDPKVSSVLSDVLQVGGKKLRVAAPDPLSVVITFPEPFAPGLRLLDNLPILPRHKLGSALANGSFSQAWGPGTAVEDVVGLGPFVLSVYIPGQRLVFSRNARYWRKSPDGAALPYLDRIALEIIPDQDAELLRLEGGQLDMTTSEMRPEDYALLKRSAEAGRLRILDLGVGFDADSLWFNLKPGGLGPSDPRAGWLQSDALREAVSLAVDRDLFANTVYLGAGVPLDGPITPANKAWYAPGLPARHDSRRARERLASIGLVDRNGDGMLEDVGNRPARIVLITQKGNTALERGAAVIRDELKKIGLTIDVVALEGNALIQRFLSGQYEAVYFRVAATDSDPGSNADFWLSSGSAHVWNLEQQTAATDWERRIDGLMHQQRATFDDAERRRLFLEVQTIFAEHLPTIQFAVPRILVAVSSRVTGLTPTAFSRPQLLWSPDTIAVVH